MQDKINLEICPFLKAARDYFFSVTVQEDRKILEADKSE
jgi:hypothetical protein